MLNSFIKWYSGYTPKCCLINYFCYNWLGGHQPISITENTSIDEFLSNAEAAQKSFEAERGTAAIAVSIKTIIYLDTIIENYWISDLTYDSSIDLPSIFRI